MGRIGLTLVQVALWLGLASPSSTAEVARLRFLVDLGAESLPAASVPGASVRAPIVVAVPGAAYVFALGPDGLLRRTRHLAADAAAPYGIAVGHDDLVVADRDGVVSRWTLGDGSAPSARWRQDVGERVSSIGWDGGDRVLVATWRNRLLSLAAADGRVLWSVDLGGRAEAPAVADAMDVFVATKTRVLARLDAATGALRWRVTVPGVVVHPPALSHDTPRTVVCGTWDGQLLAYEAATGRLRWSAVLPAKLASPPLTLSDFVGVVTADGAVHAYDSSGKARWSQPGAALGPATLLPPFPASAAPRLLAVSRVIVALDLEKGTREGEYPQGAQDALRQRFADAMLDGVKTFSEGEKRTIIDREAFDITGPLFGPARTVGTQIAFGTEEGWAYLFDPSLRPIARYHAGEACRSAPSGAAGGGVAIAGGEIFGLDLSNGRTLWKRGLGAETGVVSGGQTLAVVAGGRVEALDVRDGIPRWSLHGAFRSAVPPAAGDGPWLVDDGEGHVRALAATGRLMGEPLAVGGDLLAMHAMSSSWITATREGRIVALAWQDVPSGALVVPWEKVAGERLRELHAGAGLVVAQGESGALWVLSESGQERGKLRANADDRVLSITPEAIVVAGLADIRVLEIAAGAVKFQMKVSSPAIGALLDGARLSWLDRAGEFHRVELQTGAAAVTSVDLGVPLATAVPADAGFVISTAAGEVGFIETTDRPVAIQASEQRGERQ